MRGRGRSDVPFLDVRSGAALDALAGARIDASSSGLGWSGMHVEIGRHQGWEADDVSVAHHYLALNTDAAPLIFEAKIGGAFRRTTLAPGEVWFCPAGESFSHRVATPCGFALVTLEPSRLVRTVDDPGLELRRTYALRRPQLEHLVRALAAETESGGPSGSLYVDALATALAVQLAQSFAARRAPPATPGRLGAAALRRVLETIDTHLGEALTVERLAGAAGLAAAPFARAFRAATGESPYQFVLRRRLDEARKALEGRAPDILDVALRLGFADQAHLTRLFKRRFGVPPGEFVRQRAR